MDWVWRNLSQYIRLGSVPVEFHGITAEELQSALRQEALRRLGLVEAIVFCDEVTDTEKIQSLVEQFSQW